MSFPTLYGSVCTVILLLLLSCQQQDTITILPPDELYGDLFSAVQNDSTVFSDSKTFVDCIPNFSPADIRIAFMHFRKDTGGSLGEFVKQHFTIPAAAPAYTADSLPIDEHISLLWNVLKRPADLPRSGTRIPLPHPYIVPGGRFREIYYWDSYFTMLGLAVDEKYTTMKHMVDNFAWLIDTLGFIPNGNRTYYLSRSQPPFFASMVTLLTETIDTVFFEQYLPALEKEYAFWMAGSDTPPKPGHAHRRVVSLDDGTMLNRYWDDKATPRSESYREDRRTALQAQAADNTLSESTVYRHLRAAAESGWDFSSRWLTCDSSGTFPLHTIHTTDIIPVDLNSLLYTTERVLCDHYTTAGDSTKADYYENAAARRKKALQQYCWNSDSGYFFDYDFTGNRQTGIVSAAGIYPLFFGMADSAQAADAASFLQTRLLFPGGIAATVNTTGQQWDKPNGWPPLQWIAVAGLRRYGIDSLADDITTRWCTLNRNVYTRTFKMAEKFNVVDTTKESGGGEYPTQDGFGWTNGVYLKLSTLQ